MNITDDKFHIVPGELVKYQLKIKREDFDPQTNDFQATIYWGLFGQSLTITREQTYHDEEWNLFVLFDTSGMVGTLKAVTEYLVSDTDADDGFRVCTDSQNIGIVSESPCCLKPRKCKKGTDERFVQWERIYRSDARTLYLNLRTSEGEYLKDINDQQLKVRKHNLI